MYLPPSLSKKPSHCHRESANRFLRALVLSLVWFCCQDTRATESTQAVLLKAEGFEKTGGWLIDQQSMDQMGPHTCLLTVWECLCRMP